MTLYPLRIKGSLREHLSNDHLSNEDTAFQPRRTVHKSTSELGTPLYTGQPAGSQWCLLHREVTMYMATIFCNSWPGPSVWNVQHHLMSHLRINDVVEAHCYVVNIGQTDREQIRSRQFCKQLTKGLRGRNVLNQLLLFLLRICSQSVCPISFINSWILAQELDN